MRISLFNTELNKVCSFILSLGSCSGSLRMNPTYLKYIHTMTTSTTRRLMFIVSLWSFSWNIYIYIYICSFIYFKYQFFLYLASGDLMAPLAMSYCIGKSIRYCFWYNTRNMWSYLGSSATLSLRTTLNEVLYRIPNFHYLILNFHSNSICDDLPTIRHSLYNTWTKIQKD